MKAPQGCGCEGALAPTAGGPEPVDNARSTGLPGRPRPGGGSTLPVHTDPSRGRGPPEAWLRDRLGQKGLKGLSEVHATLTPKLTLPSPPAPRCLGVASRRGSAGHGSATPSNEKGADRPAGPRAWPTPALGPRLWCPLARCESTEPRATVTGWPGHSSVTVPPHPLPPSLLVALTSLPPPSPLPPPSRTLSPLPVLLLPVPPPLSPTVGKFHHAEGVGEQPLTWGPR